MKNINDICIVIQARLNSQRCPYKMVRAFGPSGETLLDIVLAKLQACKIPRSQQYLSVHEKALKDIGSKYDVNIYNRSYESANTDSNLQLMYEWHSELVKKYTWVIKINPCLPFLDIKTVNNFIQQYCEHNHNGQFGVIKTKDYYWSPDHNLITPWPKGQGMMNTKEVQVTYKAAHALYAGKIADIYRGIWMAEVPFIKLHPVLFEMEEQECLDIDHEWQFQMLKAYYRQSIADEEWSRDFR